MARRETANKVPDSLAEVKRKEEQSKAATQTADKKLSDLTNAISAAEKRMEDVESSLESFDEERANQLEELRSLNEEIEEKKKEVRSLDGEAQVHKGAIATLKGEYDSLLQFLAAKKEVAAKDHQAQLAVYESTQKKAQVALKEIQTTIESLKKDFSEKLSVVDRLNQEAKRLELEVKPQVPQLEEKIGNLNHELLVKQKEIKDAEALHSEMVGKYHDEKVRYEEATALRQTEEERVAAELKKLIDKESEVEKKMESLRNLKEGVDNATARLQRKEKDLELKNHLANPQAVT